MNLTVNFSPLQESQKVPFIHYIQVSVSRKTSGCQTQTAGETSFTSVSKGSTLLHGYTVPHLPWLRPVWPRIHAQVFALWHLRSSYWGLYSLSSATSVKSKQMWTESSPPSGWELLWAGPFTLGKRLRLLAVYTFDFIVVISQVLALWRY